MRCTPRCKALLVLLFVALFLTRAKGKGVEQQTNTAG